MSYRIMARTTERSTGITRPTALQALQAVRSLSGDGFRLTAIIDDDGDAVPVEKLEEIARGEDHRAR